jgi:hypothetical protein
MNDHPAHKDDVVRVHPGIRTRAGQNLGGLHLTVDHVEDNPTQPTNHVLACTWWTGGTFLYVLESDVDVITRLGVA